MHRPRLTEELNDIVVKLKTMTPTQLSDFKTKHMSDIAVGENRTPKILIFDLENSPAEGYFWGLFKQNIGIDAVKENNFLLCWSAKWLLSDNIISDRLTSDEVKRKDDRRIVEHLLELFNEADIVVAHNAYGHDVPLADTRFLVHQLPPHSPVQIVDTLKVAKKQFKFISNKLDFINKVLGLDVKIHTGGMPFWVDCLNGDEDKLKEMSVYCDNDVKILEEMYLRIRGWIKNHPNINVYTDIKDECCPNCGSNSLNWSGRHKYATSANLYPTAQCNNCGAWVRDRTTELSKEQRDNLIVSIAR